MSKMVITGAAGFIGSVTAAVLQKMMSLPLVLVDDFNRADKKGNFARFTQAQFVDRKIFPQWLDQHANEVALVIHLGARTDTTEFNVEIFNELNLFYSQQIWALCAKHAIPLVYASSAATYGAGEHGYADDHALVEALKPLNPYGESKNDFDKWALKQTSAPPFWYGLKFFNVYGPNEYHKGRMASVVFHAFGQVNTTGRVSLFRSHRPDFTDGGQLRDFVYVKDVAEVIAFLCASKPESGLYNLGSGKARTFLSLAEAVFSALEKQPDIQFVDTPIDIRDKYQYFTEAKIDKLRQAGYNKPFFSLEDGIADYVQNYLVNGSFF